MAFIHPENRLEDQDDELAWGVIIVEKDHLPQRWPPGLRL
jgi:hypothetical protein